MYTDEELKDILLEAISSHQSLDHKLHLMEAVEDRFEKLERYNKVHQENQWLYGKLNIISDTIEESRKEVPKFI
jgi:DNA polymerase II large subunit